MSSHQGMMYPWGFHGNGVPSLSSVNPMATHPASAVNAPTAVSHSPASGSGRAPPSSTSRNGVVLANADEDDDSEESDDDDTSGSESDSEEEVEVERGDVDDFESLRSGIAGDSVMFPPALPGEEKVNDFPIDAAAVFSRVARDLGITPPQSVQEPTVQGIFSAAGHSLSQPINPVLTLPADLRAVWKDAGSHPIPRFRTTLRVSDEDYNAYLRVPVFDPEVSKRLPASKPAVEPDAYSPLWEETLRSLDSRIRSVVRLSAFGSTVSEHLARSTARDLGGSSEIAREAYLLSDLVLKSLRSSMAIAHRLISLRQSNVLAFLRPTYGTRFTESLKKVELSSQEHLFGNQFCNLVTKGAKEVTEERALVESEAALKFTKKRKRPYKRDKSKSKKAKSNPGRAKSQPTPSAPGPSTSGTSFSGKRRPRGPPSSHPPGRKSRGGKKKKP